MNGFSKWVEKHEAETERQNEMIVELKIATEKLVVIAEASERRLERLEDR